VTDSGFVLADIDKLVQFEKKSEEAIEEFDAIKKEFERINETLLANGKVKAPTRTGRKQTTYLPYWWYQRCSGCNKQRSR